MNNLVDKKFWFVFNPTESSTILDVLYESSIKNMSNQFHGGLKKEDILGMFETQNEALEYIKKNKILEKCKKYVIKFF